MPAFLFVEMVSKVQAISKQVEDLVVHILEELGYELVDVQYLSSHGRWVLRLRIDKAEGVTIDDCARVSGEIGDLIDIKEIIPHEYVLEVSSPGLDRPLKKEKHFQEAVGKKVKVITSRMIQGRRTFVGYLSEFKAGVLLIRCENRPISISFKDVEQANVIYEFDK